MNAKLDRRNIMLRSWELRRAGCSASVALKSAWAEAREAETARQAYRERRLAELHDNQTRKLELARIADFKARLHAAKLLTGVPPRERFGGAFDGEAATFCPRKKPNNPLNS